MDRRKVRETLYKNAPAIFLGSMMVICGLIMTIIRFTPIELWGINFSSDDGPLGIFARFLLIVGGLIILIKRQNGNYFAIGVYALALGISRLLRSLPNLVIERSDYLPQNDLIFNMTIFIVILSANLALTGYNHLTVRMKNPIIMRYTTLGIVAFYAIVLLYFQYIDKSPEILMEYLPDVLWYIPLYVALLIVLFSKEVVDNCPMGRLERFSREMVDKFDLGYEIKISEEDAAKIREGFGDHKGWKERPIGDSRVYEESAVFRTARGDRDVVLERCDADSDLRITIMDDMSDSFINGYRIRASSYSETEGRMELRDRTGVCAIFCIGGDDDGLL